MTRSASSSTSWPRSTDRSTPLELFVSIRRNQCARVLTAWAQSVIDTDNAVLHALDQGGKTVMVTSLGTLLRKGGMLDRLRAHGITVESPE